MINGGGDPMHVEAYRTKGAFHVAIRAADVALLGGYLVEAR